MMKKILFCCACFAATLSVALAQPLHLASGALRRLENFPSRFVPARNVDVWLPDGYTAKKRYAVLYMHDGQMLFDSTTNWNRQEWGVDETMGRLLREKKIRNCIVVGIWNTPDRHLEYAPQRAYEAMTDAEKQMLRTAVNPVTGKPLLGDGPVSDKYLKFIVQELKPFIDSAFSTRKDRKNTFVAGSSMGGLISLYALCEYPDVFGGAACLSTHWPGIFRLEDNPVPAALMEYLRGHLPPPKGHRLYFDYGTATLDAWYMPFQQRADAILKAKGYTAKNWVTRAFEGDDHSERAWARRLSIPLLFLLSD